MPDYSKVIKPELEKIHKAVDQARSSLGIKDVNSRDARHKFWRHNLLLFYRFCTDDQDGITIEMSTTKKQNNERAVERLLSQWIKEHGVEELRKTVTSFNTTVTNYAGFIHELWREVGSKDRNRTINSTLFRWLLEIDIYRRYLKRSQSDYEQFVRQLWELWSKETSNSAARFPAIGDKGNPLTVQLGKAPWQAGVLSRQLGSDFTEKKTRQPKKTQFIEARLGMQEDHYDKPFAIHGNGPTRAEPASRNMARGSRLPKNPEEEKQESA